MPLTVRRRQDRAGVLTICGTVTFPDGSGVRVRQRAQSNEPGLAREEASALEARLLRDAWHGRRRGALHTLGQAVDSYLDVGERGAGTEAFLHRLLKAIGDRPLAEIDQALVDSTGAGMFPPDAAGRTAAPATQLRNLVTPLRAVLNHAARRGWCEAPRFEGPKLRHAGRTRTLTPAEAERLVAAGAPHLRPLFLFLIGTGARLAEALELDWRDVDLAGARAIFWRTKSGGRRVAALPPRIVAALAALPAGPDGAREGPVFRRKLRRAGAELLPYADKGRESGGQIKSGWKGAMRRSGLAASSPGLTPHDLRHTYASWHYARHKDLLKLKADGGWASVALVERYAHLLPEGHAAAIGAFLGEVQGSGIRNNQGPERTGIEEEHRA